MSAHTQAIEDYLKAVYDLQTRDERVSTSALADRLGVAAASATGMIKKLSAMELVTYERYHGVQLTSAGRAIALEVIRHHRLIELYLARALGVPWDRVHEEAEKLEHVLSEDIEDRMAEALGDPDFDPHGAPIPRRDGTMRKRERIPLLSLEPGQTAVVSEVSDHDAELLRYLGDVGLYPRTPLRVVDVGPYNGPITLEIGEDRHVVGREAAQHVYVGRVAAEETD